MKKLRLLSRCRRQNFRVNSRPKITYPQLEQEDYDSVSGMRDDEYKVSPFDIVDKSVRINPSFQDYECKSLDTCSCNSSVESRFTPRQDCVMLTHHEIIS